MSAFDRYVHALIDGLEKTVPCNFGCGARLNPADSAHKERLAHYEACEKTSPLMRRAAGLIRQNHTLPQEA